MQDKIKKKRCHNQKKTHCPMGHEYTYINPVGSRKCRVCVLASGRKHYNLNIEEMRKKKREQMQKIAARKRAEKEVKWSVSI